MIHFGVWPRSLKLQGHKSPGYLSGIIMEDKRWIWLKTAHSCSYGQRIIWAFLHWPRNQRVDLGDVWDTKSSGVWGFGRGGILGEALLAVLFSQSRWFLEIGGYEEDVTEQNAAFLQGKLPKADFQSIAVHLQGIYVDIDERDNLKKNWICNQCLAGAGYSTKLEHDDGLLYMDLFLVGSAHMKILPNTRISCLTDIAK